MIRTHQFMLEHYNTFQPYIKLMVFTKNVDILAFCEQQNITSISYYKYVHHPEGDGLEPTITTLPISTVLFE